MTAYRDRMLAGEYDAKLASATIDGQEVARAVTRRQQKAGRRTATTRRATKRSTAKK